MRFHRRGEKRGWRALHRNAEDGVPYRVGAEDGGTVNAKIKTNGAEDGGTVRNH